MNMVTVLVQGLTTTRVILTWMLNFDLDHAVTDTVTQVAMHVNPT